MKEKKEKYPYISISGSGKRNDERSNEATVVDLSSEELEKFRAIMNNGQYWMTKDDAGNLKFIPRRQELPEPEKDWEMMPYWREPTTRERQTLEQKQLELFTIDFSGKKDHYSAGIYIQHLCGYNWSEKYYRHCAAVLKSYGFDCLRSRRCASGKYWEVWHLSSLYFSKGKLKSALEKEGANLKNKEEELDFALRFITQHVTYGTMDATTQRYAMCLD